MSRPRPTVADYMVIALSPLLIMTLVGSLVFFLLTVFYQGQYESRLHFIMAMFVMAAVLIGRISIQDGREYSLLFAIPLGIVTALAANKFVEFHGALANWSLPVSLGLIGLIWWCADRLTWDCTVIDESQDASGEGLLQTVGLDADQSAGSARSRTPAARDVEGTTSPEPATATGDAVPGGLWRRFIAHRRRPHSPGVWVIYFSLAALPVFGFGQWFVYASDLAGRRYVFQLLVVYVASALGLLLTTSFLGLRRYLRQRRLEMPGDMAAVWLTVGAAMIVAVLLACMLLPRRNPEYSVTQLPIFAGSPDNQRTSRWAFGHDGPNKEGADRVGPQQGESETGPASKQGKGAPTQGDSAQGTQNAGARKSDDGDQSARSSASESSSRGDSPSSPPRDKSPNEAGRPNSPSAQRTERGERGESSQGDRRAGGEQGEPRRGGDPQNAAPDRHAGGKNQDASGSASPGRSERSQRAQQSDSDSETSRPRPSDAGQKPATRGEERRQAAEQRPEGQPERPADNASTQPTPATESASSPSSWSVSRLLSSLGAGLGWLLRALYWLIAAAVVVYLLWRYWPQVAEAVRHFLQSLREFWQRLFGGQPSPTAEEAVAPEVAPPPRPFADYRDPFLTGDAERWAPDELLRYSFQAFEAWARERGYARSPEQTPSEFVQGVAARERQLAREALQMADLYNLFAYGKKSAGPLNTAPVRRLWVVLRGAAA